MLPTEIIWTHLNRYANAGVDPKDHEAAACMLTSRLLIRS